MRKTSGLSLNTRKGLIAVLLDDTNILLQEVHSGEVYNNMGTGNGGI